MTTELPGGLLVLDLDERAALATLAAAASAWWRGRGAAVPTKIAGLIADAAAVGPVGRVSPSILPGPFADVASQQSAACSPDNSSRRTTQETADRLGISPQSVRGLCARRTLDAVRDPSDRWLITEQSIDTYLTRRTPRAGNTRPTA